MARLINIGFGNVVNSQKIVAVVSPDAAPVKRMVQSIKGTRSLIDATQGRKTKAVIVTSDDYLVLSALQDALVPQSETRRMLALRPGCQHVAMRGPHGLLQAEPHGTARAIAAFVEQLA